MEASVTRRVVFVTMMVLAVGALTAPAYAQEAARTAAAGGSEVAKWSIITAGFALAIAAALGAVGQGRSISSAVEGIARNPSAAGEIRGNLILGLVLIESLVIFGLLISLVLFLVKPFPA
jgi:F-type H+-transporting ATPase subunit c